MKTPLEGAPAHLEVQGTAVIYWVSFTAAEMCLGLLFCDLLIILLFIIVWVVYSILLKVQKV